VVSQPGAGPVSTVVAGRRLRLTNLDKVLYPASGTTKAELIGYVVAMAQPLLRQLAGRPITRRRWPDGVGQPDFFEKAVRPGTPTWIGHVELRRSSDEFSGYIDYPLLAGEASDAAALVWLAQQGVLEFHTPQWRIGRKFGRHGTAGPADRMVLDLDPGPPAGLAECAEVALVAREILLGAGFQPIPVASGSKGLHVYVPLPRPVTSDAAVELARTMAEALAMALPRLVELKMAKDRRPGRVFVDVGQNLAARTTITPYSPRGRDHPFVATPLRWAEVESGSPAPADVRTMPARFAEHGDLMGPG
jgi:bifunctional non-homologous end joining protein LigD